MELDIPCHCKELSELLQNLFWEKKYEETALLIAIDILVNKEKWDKLFLKNLIRDTKILIKLL